ncbi:MAG: hypothetical protein FK733_02365 [Asgard group archaeon]|nr:hypothetical protein [Asgard group archaeon]
MREKFDKWKKIFIFVISLGLLLLFGALVVFSNHWLDLLNGFLISGILVTGSGLTGFFYFRQRIRDHIKAIQELPEPVSSKEEISVIADSHVDIADQKKEQKITQSKSRYKYIKFKRLPKNTKCKISKTEFKEKDKIIRCSNCYSYYLESYFLKWINENNYCPVCRSIFKKN